MEQAGDEAYSFSSVGKWLSKIRQGRTDLFNQKQPGRPKDDSIREHIRNQIDKDPRFSARTIAQTTQHSPTTVSKILKEDLDLEYRHLQPVPHKLTDYKRTKRVKEAKAILDMLQSAHNSHNTNIITGDESWFRYTN